VATDLNAPTGLALDLVLQPQAARFNVLGVGLDPLTMDRAVAEIEAMIARSDPGYVTACTVNCVMECWRSEEMRTIVNESALVTADGMPLVWLLRGAHTGAAQVCGPDLMLELASRSAETGARHFFYGGGDGVAQGLAERLTGRLPGLAVAGTLSPAYGSAEELATDEVAEVINAARPDVVWVGLGTPKQERWMRAMRGRLAAPVLIGVGAAFDFHAGRRSRPPRWLTGLGLEWSYRLSQEPRRLWRRYLLSNPAFLYLVAVQLLRLRSYNLD
jgi:N-acetylglucosaminyldiphosphoundecaprenol N-acetyl-beta-D-mannosaminyltransferase